MVKNLDLERVGKDVLRNILKSARLPVELADDVEIQVDEDYRIRMMSGRGIIYVFDFTKANEDNVSAKELYNKAVQNTEMMHEHDPQHFEEVAKVGVVDNRFGYYVTKI